ncbi:HET-domain-containing protein [Annulohypoxylon maeteangense]|uniref:HET-domain-containing protein n=1 Tax=Annulohypoxylon maeteangense TaxID=1927788 RepID=UPI002008DEA2|nr:HET-domain-containing protein [Annulohypoxylon maeteangense]KAI0883551.1 HET-domain-containing protein [Annulohypoxylon maeteangense]
MAERRQIVARKRRTVRHQAATKKREMKTRNECEICQRILSLLTMPLDLRGDIRHHLNLELPKLFEDTRCENHLNLIARSLSIDSSFSQLSGIQILGFRGLDHIKIFAQKGRDFYFLESGELRLLPTPRCPSTWWGRVVNSKWIDYHLPRRWKEACDKTHKCSAIGNFGHMSSQRPSWVVDTWLQCLVPCSSSTTYVALSYVWGGVPSFMTLRENVDQLRKPSSLAEGNTSVQIPKTVRHAMSFVQRLGERYLWVDTLCVIQDDEQKLVEIAKMAAIYANATVTIVALGGVDADSGLCGLQGISDPRSLKQVVHPLIRGTKVIETHGQKINEKPAIWNTRGWTFQEALFSKKRINFDNDSIRWECQEEVTKEFGNGGGASPRIFAKAVPDVMQLSTIIMTYNTKDLTFPEDALFAFSGIASALSSTYYGGFVSGLPVLLFHIGLLWKPTSILSRRTPKRPGERTCLPSWSWAGWKGSIWCWTELAIDFAKKCSARGSGIALERVYPLVEWSWLEKRDGERTTIQDCWYEYKNKFSNKLDEPCPTGWTRHRIADPLSVAAWQRAIQPEPQAVPLCFYTHDSEPESEFWYPLPTKKMGQRIEAQIFAPLIACKTRRSWLLAAEGFEIPGLKRGGMVSLRDHGGNWAGALLLHEPLLKEADRNGHYRIKVELVEIASGRVRNDSRDIEPLKQPLEEWDLDERPKSGLYYEYYYVLWVEWRDGVAYRKGLGRVEKRVWELQDREWVDLVLG